MSAPSMSISCSATSGWLLKKGDLLWNKYFCILTFYQGAHQLFWYINEKDPAPKNSLVITAKTLLDTESEGVYKKGYFGFVLRFPTKKHILCTEDAGEQNLWINALLAAGAKPAEDPTGGPTVNETSFYEFSYPNIDREIFQFSRFQGRVSLVVNVASS